jgi:hypothetical protein
MSPSFYLKILVQYISKAAISGEKEPFASYLLYAENIGFKNSAFHRAGHISNF